MKLAMILLLILMLLTFLFTQLTLSMGLTLMINTTITSLMITSLSESPWFSYMFLLVFLGGVLVLFAYVTSLASNEMFHLNTKMMILPSTIVTLINTVMMMY